MTNENQEAGAEETVDIAAGFDLMDISVDIDARDNGVWIHGPKGFKHLSFKVLGESAPRVMALEVALSKDRPEKYGEDDKVTLERNRYENRKKCELALLDWEPFKLRGELTQYSAAKKKELLFHRNFEKFVVAVMRAMGEADNVQLKWDKATEKNSGDGSEKSSTSETDKAA